MTKPLHILVVDDDRNMSRTLTDILSASGYHAITSVSAEEGLLKMSTASFDCIVSDMIMPGMNGVEFQQAIKEKHGDIPILFITAYAGDDMLVKARAQGAAAFLEKPLNIPLLLSFLKAISSDDYQKDKQ